MRVAIALSGGVDSAASAIILQDRGYDVFAVTMRNTDTPMRAAEKMAAALGIEHHVFDLREAFKAAVIDPFLKAYLGGRTPNPCVLCNPTIKFGLLLERALAFGAERFATGHYARVLRDDAGGRYLLARADNRNKDQSYVLYRLKQEQLQLLIFPMGTIKTKEEAREIVRRRGIKVPAKESQEICFIPGGDYRSCIQGVASEIKPGPVFDHYGNIVGKHRGLAYYTVGQRRGLGIALGFPAYVIKIDAVNNSLVVGPEEMLYQSECLVGETNFISIASLNGELPVDVKVRYTAPARPAIITPAGEDKVRVKFLKPERAITPGQAAVFYDGDIVVGGGTILKMKNER